MPGIAQEKKAYLLHKNSIIENEKRNQSNLQTGYLNAAEWLAIAYQDTRFTYTQSAPRTIRQLKIILPCKIITIIERGLKRATALNYIRKSYNRKLQHSSFVYLSRVYYETIYT